jgi:putative membrane protein
MKKTILTTALTICFAALGLAAQGLTGEEQKFVLKAAKSDETEISLSKLALQKSSDPQIKQFAEMMVTDHTKSTSMLKPIAMRHDVAIPENPGPANDAKYRMLEGKSGKAFDKAYIQTMVADHQSTLQAFQSASGQVQNPKLKEFITTVEPIVKHHLDVAKQLSQGEKGSNAM